MATSESVDYVLLSKQGVTLMLNNDWKQAEQLFNEHKDASTLMCAGSSFVSVLQGMMSFEEEKLEEAARSLHETITRCKHHSTDVKSQRRSSVVSGSSEVVVLAERLQNQIIATDCQLFQAGLIIIKQDISSYIKGGWHVRHAWKSYKKLYNEIKKLRTPEDVMDGETDHVLKVQQSVDDDATASKSESPNLDDRASPILVQHGSGRKKSQDSEKSSQRKSLSDSAHEHTDADAESIDLSYTQSQGSHHSVVVSKAVKNQLLAAVCFGYGSFQLMISLCPPKILRMLQFLGLEGDQAEGLECLEITSRGDGMMAPLATLMLVWYHTVVRPFFALDGANMSAGLDEATRMLDHASLEYPSSALFFYFRSRICILQSNTEEALVVCHKALAMSINQRETQQICLYEIGRLSILRMDWSEGSKCFARLKEESKWSRCFYAYLAAICYGSNDEFDKAKEMIEQVPNLTRNRNNPIEIFVIRRGRQLSKMTITREQMRLLAMEMLYIWTFLPFASTAQLNKLLEVCGESSDSCIPALSGLVAGIIHKGLGNLEKAEQCLQMTVDCYDNDKHHEVDSHWAAFACYELGMIKSNTEMLKSKDYFQRVKNNYKNYDFEQRLTIKTNHALKRISEQEQSGGRSCLIQ